MTGSANSGWRLVPRLLLRRAGFPFELVEELADARVAEAAAAYRDAEAAVSACRDRLLRQSIPAAVSACRERADRDGLRALSTARSAVGRDRPVPDRLPTGPHAAAVVADLRQYGTAYTRARAAEVDLLDMTSRERADRGAHLRKVLDSTVLDALLQLAPSCYDGVRRWMDGAQTSPTARDRALLRRLYLYCQRLAAKNETTSFFGPLIHGVVEPGATGVAWSEQTEQGILQTQPFLAFWAVTALARRMAEDPRVRPAVPVSWVPANRLAGDRLTLADGRNVRLGEPIAALAGAVDGHRSATELAAHSGQPIQTVLQRLTQLERLGVLRVWPEPGSTAGQPFDELLADADRYAGNTEWPARLRELWTLVRGYSDASDHERRRAALTEVELRFGELTSVSARRSGGRMYADRSVTYLECRGDEGPARLGADLAERIERDLAPVLDLGARHGELLHQAHQQLATAVLRDAGTTRMPYDEFIERMQEQVSAGRLQERLAAAEALTVALTDLVRRHLAGTDCTLNPAALRTLGAPDGRARFASPDLLIRRVGDELTFVLGEVHPYVFAWGSQRLFCDDPAGLDADFRADLSPWGGPAAMATVLRRRRHKGLVAQEFPGRFIEVTAVASRQRDRCLPITDLVVELDGDRILLRGGGGELVLYAGEEDHPHLVAFAPPPTSRLPLIRIGDVAPRITIGSVVAQRAGWWLPATNLTGQSEASAGPDSAGGRCSPADVAFRSVQRLRSRHALPRWVYAHVTGEPKPVCVDLDAPLAVEALAGLIGTAEPDQSVLLREMLPEPEHLWLRRNGRPVTSELRLALIRGARPKQGQA